MHRFASRFSVSRVRYFMLQGCVLLLGASASAQGRFCVGGDLDHLSAPERAACSAKLREVRSAAQRFGAPQNWHFVMVCGADGWKAYVDFSTRARAELAHATADTDFAAHSTYLREESFSNGELNAASQRMLAHEIAAIVLQTTDETAILSRVDLLLKQAPAGAGNAALLTASR